MTVDEALAFADEACEPEVSFNNYEYGALRKLASEVRRLREELSASNVSRLEFADNEMGYTKEIASLQAKLLGKVMADERDDERDAVVAFLRNAWNVSSKWTYQSLANAIERGEHRR